VNVCRDISADILAHWMDLLNTEGWIPRSAVAIFGKDKIRFEIPIINS
jgi:hypothetical protein